MDEHPPSIGPHQPLDRRTRAVGLELVAALTVAHAVGLALAIELRSALTEAEEWAFRQQERHVRRLRVEHEALNRHAGGRLDVHRWRLRGEAHRQIPRPHRLECLRRPAGTDTLRRVGLREPAIDWHPGWRAVDDRKDVDAYGGRAERRHDDLDWLAADHDVGRPARG